MKRQNVKTEKNLQYLLFYIKFLICEPNLG